MEQHLIPLITLLLGFALTFIFTKVFLPILRKKKIGQKILEIGPAWHMSKQGTPTMGGICFILSFVIVSLLTVIYFVVRKKTDTHELIPYALTLALSVAFAMIGFIDDYAKLIKKQNEGLTEIQKLVLQTAVGAAYIAVMAYTGNLKTSFAVPFTSFRLELGVFYYFFALLFIVGFVNSTNITDGIDGLAATVTLTVMVFLTAVSLKNENIFSSPLTSSMIGCMAAFLIFNFHPAKIFMGDTGSLFIGGLIMGVAFMLDAPIAIMLASLIYIIEMISSLLQRVYYKLTKKRLFKMAPLHHHFEKCGWSEEKIVFVFTAFTVVCCVIMWFGIKP